jgi:hypothetical protein
VAFSQSRSRGPVLICFHRQSAVDNVIAFMDEYFISREDLDTLIELGVDELQDEIVNKKIASATKAALTRKCVQWECNASTRH